LSSRGELIRRGLNGFLATASHIKYPMSIQESVAATQNGRPACHTNQPMTGIAGLIRVVVPEGVGGQNHMDHRQIHNYILH